MKNRKQKILVLLFILSFIALAMKKLMVPFQGIFLIVIFDGIAVFYFIRAFTAEKPDNAPGGRSFRFDLGSIAYAVCSIGILYRLQYWAGWERWITVSGFLFFIVTLLTLLSVYFFFKLPGRKIKAGTLLLSNLSWIYFLLLFPAVAFTNPRKFHNLFNGTTYEEYVRARYPADRGTELLNRFKPAGEKSKKRSAQFLAAALQSEQDEEFDEALANYNKAIDINPENAEAIYHRGRLKLTRLEIDKERMQSVYQDFSRAIQLDSSLASAYYHRAVAYNYLYPKYRLPARNDLIRAKSLDTTLSHDHFLNEFLKLPLVDSTVDTTDYVKLDEPE